MFRYGSETGNRIPDTRYREPDRKTESLQRCGRERERVVFPRIFFVHRRSPPQRVLEWKDPRGFRCPVSGFRSSVSIRPAATFSKESDRRSATLDRDRSKSHSSVTASIPGGVGVHGPCEGVSELRVAQQVLHCSALIDFSDANSVRVVLMRPLPAGAEVRQLGRLRWRVLILRWPSHEQRGNSFGRSRPQPRHNHVQFHVPRNRPDRRGGA